MTGGERWGVRFSDPSSAKKSIAIFLQVPKDRTWSRFGFLGLGRAQRKPDKASFVLLRAKVSKSPP